MKTVRTFATMYSGGGVADVGLRSAGLVHRWGIELEAERVAVARANGFDVTCGDVLAFSINGLADFAPVDWLHASPPCDNFSQGNAESAKKPGGRATAHDLRLALAVADVAATLRPEWISAENVLGWRDTPPERELRAALLGLGYKVARFHLNAADFGVPMHRNRVFLVAGLRREPTRPEPTHSRELDLLRRPWVGWDQVCPDWHGLDVRPLTDRMEKLLAYVEKKANGKLLVNSVSKNHRAKTIPGDALAVDSRYNLKPKLVHGGCFAPLQDEKGTRLPIYRHEGEPCPSFTTRSVMQVVTEEGARTLSPAHLKALMGMPPDWVAPDSLTLLRSILGLGICPPVMKALVEAQR